MKMRFLHITILMCFSAWGAEHQQAEGYKNLATLNYILKENTLEKAHEQYNEITVPNKLSFINLLIWGHKIGGPDYANASYFLGLAFFGGSYGAPQDAAKAFDCFQKSALYYNLSAQINCARMLYYGTGIQEDKPQALRWFLEAGIKGEHLESLLIAGKMLIDGDGVAKDMVRGKQLINTALDNGFQVPLDMQLKLFVNSNRKSILCACAVALYYCFFAILDLASVKTNLE